MDIHVRSYVLFELGGNSKFTSSQGHPQLFNDAAACITEKLGGGLGMNLPKSYNIFICRFTTGLAGYYTQCREICLTKRVAEKARS